MRTHGLPVEVDRMTLASAQIAEKTCSTSLRVQAHGGNWVLEALTSDTSSALSSSGAIRDVLLCTCDVSQALLHRHLSTCRVPMASRDTKNGRYSTQKNSSKNSNSNVGSVMSARELTPTPLRNVESELASANWRSEPDERELARAN